MARIDLNGWSQVVMKIFCIGFPKTGTSSMRAALERLGFSVHGPFGMNDPRIAETAWEQARQLVPLYDAFEDDPWPLLYERLDHAYPGSKFILTVRDTDAWLTSLIRHSGERNSPLREWAFGFGNPRGHEVVYRQRFERHNAEVREYFSGREGTHFLVMNIMAGDGWIPLCRFLGSPVPHGKPFPHKNRAGESDRRNTYGGRILGLLRHVRRRLTR